MSKATEKEFYEFFERIAEKRISKKAFKELVERSGKIMASPRLFKKSLEKARELAAEIKNPYIRANVRLGIAVLSEEAEDWEEARKAIEEISNPYVRVEEMLDLALRTQQAQDFEKIWKAVTEIGDSDLRTKALANIVSEVFLRSVARPEDFEFEQVLREAAAEMDDSCWRAKVLIDILTFSDAAIKLGEMILNLDY